MLACKWSRNCAIYGSASYLGISVHAFSYHPLNDFIYEVIALPILGGIGAGLLGFLVELRERGSGYEELELIAETSFAEKLTNALVIIPVIVTAGVILLAQIYSSYEDVGWWIISLGCITGLQTGQWLACRRICRENER